jgi:addiction module HigA family antidote
MSKNGTRPVHLGEVLREDCLKPLGMTANALAEALHVPASRTNGIVLERRGVTPDTALRLTRYFGGKEADAQGWINMQATYDFKVAQKEVGKVIAKVKPREDAVSAPNDKRFTLAPLTGACSPRLRAVMPASLSGPVSEDLQVFMRPYFELRLPSFNSAQGLALTLAGGDHGLPRACGR